MIATLPAITPPLHYLALGDSYTIGESVAVDRRWPVVLVDRLRKVGVVIDDPQIVAVTGWTTDELAAGMDAATLKPPYDLVTLQIGVNNQYRGRSTADYRSQFAQMLARATELAGGKPDHVVVVSIPDWGVTRFARENDRDATRVGSEIDAYNAIARGETTHSGARFVDITDISRTHPQLLAEDGLHPAAAQYALWVERIEPASAAAVYSP